MKANNKYLSDYNLTVPSTFGLFLDKVNLYGGTVLKPLPVGDFQLVHMSLDEILEIPEDSDFGCFVQVGINYPEELHCPHNDLPLGAEKMKVSVDMLSDYQKQLGG